jgi:SAM-dependent methyltransferase
MTEHIKKLKAAIKSSLDDNSFVKISLGDYKGADPNLKNLYIKQLFIKNVPHLSFTYRNKTNDIVKNYAIVEAIDLIENFVSVNGFRIITLFTLTFDMTLVNIKGSKWTLTTKQPTNTQAMSVEHDKPKKRKIETTGKRYLAELKITDGDGHVFKNAQDKYRQINHYIEILSSLLAELPSDKTLNVVDMGSGKGYLTFALYDYLNNVVDKSAKVTGVEFRKDMVELCNKIATNSGFNDLNFVENTIENYQNPNIDVLIALHACDTATDDAIFKGITANADLIVVAPCCHKQIRREIEKYKPQNDLDFLTKYGIFLERQAEMVTDGIRALILNYYGYSTKIFEFISDAHTPKNVLIVGQKRINQTIDRVTILQKIKDTKSYFGIGYHHLERVAGL